MVGLKPCRVVPYDVVKVLDSGGVLVRFANGTYVELTAREYFTLAKIPYHYALVPITADEYTTYQNLRKLGVVHEIDWVDFKPDYFIVYKVTKGCNLACKYCYEWANPGKIDIRSSLRVADAVFKKIIRDARGHFVFHGGEPTLYAEDIIVPVVRKYSNSWKWRGRLQFGLQSNGVRFADEEFARWFGEFAKKYDVRVGISLDGFREDNWMRQFPDGTPAWDYTVQGIENLGKYGVLSRGVIVVVNDRSDDHLDRIARWLHDDLDVHGARFNPLYPAGHPEVVKHAPDPEEYVDSLIKVAKYMMDVNLDGDRVRDEFTAITVSDYVEAVFGKSSTLCVNSVCGMGMNFFAIEPDGTVYPCDHAYMFPLGNILDRGWSPERAWSNPDLQRFWQKQSWVFQEVFSGNSECASCPYRTYCDKGGCSVFHYEMYGEDFYKRGGRYCMKKLFRFITKLIEDGDDARLIALAPKSLRKYWYLR